MKRSVGMSLEQGYPVKPVASTILVALLVLGGVPARAQDATQPPAEATLDTRTPFQGAYAGRFATATRIDGGVQVMGATSGSATSLPGSAGLFTHVLVPTHSPGFRNRFPVTDPPRFPKADGESDFAASRFTLLFGGVVNPAAVKYGSFLLTGPGTGVVFGTYEGRAFPLDDAGLSRFAGTYTIAGGSAWLDGGGGSGTLYGVLDVTTGEMTITLAGSVWPADPPVP